MRKLFLFLLLFCNDCLADEWAEADTARQATFLVLHGVDFTLTSKALHKYSYIEEKNPFLNKRPNDRDLAAFTIATGVLHTWFASVLPMEERIFFQKFSIGLKGAVIVNNYMLVTNGKF